MIVNNVTNQKMLNYSRCILNGHYFMVTENTLNHIGDYFRYSHFKLFMFLFYQFRELKLLSPHGGDSYSFRNA